MIIEHVMKDLEAKNFVDVSCCVCNVTQSTYITARLCDDDLLRIVFPVGHDVALSQKWICQIFKDLTLSGDISDYNEGLLLAVVGCTMDVIYHQVFPNIQPVSRFKMKESQPTLGVQKK